jgi:hypothetical protein
MMAVIATLAGFPALILSRVTKLVTATAPRDQLEQTIGGRVELRALRMALPSCGPLAPPGPADPSDR